MTAQERSLLGQYAGFASRLAAFVIDVTIVSIILFASTWFLSTTFALLQIEAFLGKIAESFLAIKPIVNLIFNPITASIVSLIFILAYYVFFWFVAGQTPGKAVMGVRVVSLHGGKISVWQALLRYLGYYISGAAFGIGFLWILVDDRRMTWHDKIARTCVIYNWDARPDETFLTQAIQKLATRRDALSNYITRRKRHNHNNDSQ